MRKVFSCTKVTIPVNDENLDPDFVHTSNTLFIFENRSDSHWKDQVQTTVQVNDSLCNSHPINRHKSPKNCRPIFSYRKPSHEATQLGIEHLDQWASRTYYWIVTPR